MPEMEKSRDRFSEFWWKIIPHLFTRKEKEPPRAELADLWERIQPSTITRPLTLLLFFFGSLIIRLVFKVPLPNMVFLILAIWFPSGFVFTWAIQRQPTAQRMEIAQIEVFLLELLFLTCIVHYIGGVEWIGILFYTFSIMYANIILSKRNGLIVGLAAFGFYVGLILLEYFEIIPHREFFVLTPGLYQDRNYLISTVGIGSFSVFYLVSYTTGIFSDLLKKKSEALAKANKEIENEREKSFKLLLHLVPSEKVDDMINGTLQPQRVTSTIMFSDLQNFTSYSEGKDEDELTKELNDFFNAMHTIIQSHRGYENKFEGDCIMAFFGAAYPNEAHPVDAVLASLKMQNRLMEDFPQWEQRVGINTGRVLTHIVGSRDKYAWDGMGEAVNLASRMESNGVTRKVTISPYTYEKVKELFDTERSEEKKELKGFKDPMYLYYVNRLKEVTECESRVPKGSAYFAQFKLLEDELEKFSQSELSEVDLTQIDSKDGDPLHSMTTALYSLALAKILKDKGYQIDVPKLMKASFLYEIGKQEIPQNILNKRFTDESEYVEFKRELKEKTIKSLSGNSSPEIIPLIEDFYTGLATTEAQIIKIAQMYVGLTCCKFYKNIHSFGIEKTIEEIEKSNIGRELRNAMRRLVSERS